MNKNFFIASGSIDEFILKKQNMSWLITKKARKGGQNISISADVPQKECCAFSADLWSSSTPVLGSIYNVFVKGMVVAEWTNQ